MIQVSTVPPYVYRSPANEHSLLQGDVLKVGGQFRQHFVNFYPAINNPAGEDKYVMVLTQSCDLVKTKFQTKASLTILRLI